MKNVSDQPVDIEKALEQMGGDEDLLQEVLAMFVDAAPELLESLQQARTESDPKQLKSAAHRLKGVAANICAQSTEQVAAQLEQIGLSGTVADTEPLLGELELHLDRIQEFVNALDRSV